MYTRVLLTTITLGLGVLSASCTDEGSNTASDSACSDIIVSRAEPTIDVSQLHTFAVADEAYLEAALPDDLPDDAAVNIRLATQAAKKQLIELGFTEVDPKVETPDVWLFDVATTHSKTDKVWGCSGGWVWWGWGWGWDACAWTAPVDVTYDVGTLVIGLADDASQKVAFAGAMQGVLDCGNVAERIRQRGRRDLLGLPEGARGLTAERPQKPQLALSSTAELCTPPMLLQWIEWSKFGHFGLALSGRHSGVKLGSMSTR